MTHQSRAVRALAAIATVAGLGFFAALALRLLPHAPLSIHAPQSTAIRAIDGRLLRLTLAADEQYRIWTPLEDLPPQLVELLLLHEDRWFYWHPGVNPVALARSAARAATGNARSGASTLTMQLARLIHRQPTRSVAGKLRQAAAALWLTLRHSKREVLEAHLNLLPYGGNVQGVGAASLIYFGKPASKLSLPEMLALVVIPQSPQARRPAGAEPASLLAARLRLLERWRERHPADGLSLQLAREPLRYGRPQELPFRAPHATDALLAAAGPARAPGITTTIDLRLQDMLEKAIRRHVAAHRAIGVTNAAALLVDVRDGSVAARVGSASYGDAAIEGQVNGTAAKRSPGSTLKPFLYGLAIDQGLIHPRSMLKDAPTSFGPYSPENFDGRFAGPVSAQDALIGSRNVPAVALAARLSQPGLYDFLKTAGVSKMAGERHYGLALVLGGGEVTMEELATLYAALARGGELLPLREQLDEPLATPTRVLSAEASFMVTDMLSHNPRPDGGGEGSARGRPVAWKTGTSWGFRDAWAAGIVGSRVLVVWVGHFDGRGNPAFVGLQTAAPLFFAIADTLDAAFPSPAAPALQPPPSLRQVEVCQASGDLPNADCPRRTTTWFIPGRSPIAVSTVHRRFRIDTRTGRIACATTPARHVREEVIEVWPSDLAELFAKAGMPRRAPPAAGDCGEGATTTAATRPRITSPLAGVSYTIRGGLPAGDRPPAKRAGSGAGPAPDGAAVRLAAVADGAVERLYWFADDAFVAATRSGEAASWQPPGPGQYTLTVVDDRGGSDSRPVRVALVP
jgi:penicillin-binding protein 1C